MEHYLSMKIFHTWSMLPFLTIIYFLAVVVTPHTNGLPCASRVYQEDDSFVCVCNVTYCDSFTIVPQTKPGTVTIFTSDQTKHRFVQRQVQFKPNVSNNTSDGVKVKIHRDQPLQSIIGFGGALTDAAGINIKSLDDKLATNLIRDYYGPNGLRYNMIRIPIGGSDFSTRPYTYDDTEQDDLSLTHFNLTDEDFNYKIPLIKQAQKESDTELKIFGSPWSPPAWMKTNHKINGKGSLRGNPNGTYYHVWADYLVKFLDQYKSHNIDLWGMTVQNEPIDGSLTNFSFNCLGLSPEQERDFVMQVLGPKLKTAGYGIDKFQLMIADDQRAFLKQWAQVVLSDPKASKYVSGLAFHWYLNAYSSPDILTEVYHNYPGYFLLSTEACEGSYPFEPKKVALGSWLRAENYAYDIIQDLKYFTAGWVDWNIALDLEGGPNWVENFVDSPIIVNATAGEYYKQPMYYALGHFTRFIPSGSRQLQINQSDDKALNVVVFATPANSTVAIVLNRFNSTIPLQIDDTKNGLLQTNIEGHSIQTMQWFD